MFELKYCNIEKLNIVNLISILNSMKVGYYGIFVSWVRILEDVGSVGYRKTSGEYDTGRCGESSICIGLSKRSRI